MLTMSYCRQIPLLLALIPGALVTAQYPIGVDTNVAAVSTLVTDIPTSTETTYVPTSTETTYVPTSTETLHVPTTTETLITTRTTRVPMPVAGYNVLTASILSTASFLLQY